jgi:hypothetical protein
VIAASVPFTPDLAKLRRVLEIADDRTLTQRGRRVGWELEPLLSTARYFGTQQNLIITVNQEQRFDKDGGAVHAFPAWQWLLEDHPLRISRSP